MSSRQDFDGDIWLMNPDTVNLDSNSLRKSNTTVSYYNVSINLHIFIIHFQDAVCLQQLLL